MLDVDRLADAMLTGVKALIAKEIAPLRDENARLKGHNEALGARVEALEAQDLSSLERTIAETAESLAGMDIPEIPDIPSIVSELVAKAVAEIAPAKDGKDGAGIASARLNDDGELVLKLTSGDTLNVGRVVGRDGLGFDDLDVVDGERAFTLRLQRDDVTKAWELEKPGLHYCGVWAEGAYEKGDAVTWGGSLWIATRETDAKPDAGDSWRLAVKKGRDAKPQVKP